MATAEFPKCAGILSAALSQQYLSGFETAQLEFNVTVIQVYAPISNAEETEVEQFYGDLQDLLELTPKRDVLSNPMGTVEFSQFAAILSAALSQHHLSGFEIAPLEFHHLH